MPEEYCIINNADWPDPISFLNDYKEFAVNARPLLINLIVYEHSKTKDDNQKKLLNQLAMEQFMFLWETFLAYYVAATSESPVLLYKLLAKTSIFDLNQKAREVTGSKLKGIYKKEFSELGDEEIQEIVNHAMRNAKRMQELAPVTNVLIPFFNKSKHKFLVYREKNEVCILLSKECERSIAKYVKSKDIPEGWRQNMDWLVKLTESTKNLIINTIDILKERLKLPDANKWFAEAKN